ncbi:MAG: amino acid deaminase, partial [Comamonadaceae bacterium]
MTPTDFLNPLLQPPVKGLPLHVPALPLSDVGAQGWNVLADDLPFP